VNVIGEHTDYNDGLCLPFAIDAGVTVQVTDGPDASALRVRALDLGEEDAFALADPQPVRGWRAFARGMAAELQRGGWRLRGGTLTIRGDVPRGSGLSSSAALEVALALGLLAHGGCPEPDRRELARLCSRVENDWVGAQTGLLDQMAALFAQPGHALRLDVRSLEVEPVPLELDGWRLATFDSGVRHSHAVSGYNARRAECREAVRRLGIASLRDADLAGAGSLPAPLDRRVRHVVEENRRVEAAVAALRAGEPARIAALLDASHASLRDLYEVSVPELERTVREVKAAGAHGARLVGGGFGGAVLGLFPPATALPRGAFEVRPGGPAGLRPR
jgi:galactokinase